MQQLKSDMQIHDQYIVDRRDLLFLPALRMNARMGLTELGKLTGFPISSIHERLKVYDKTKLVKRYTALLDFMSLGYGIRALFFVVAHKQKRDVLRSFLSRFPAVNTLAKVNHGYDFFVDAVFRSMQDVDAFKELICQEYGVKDVQIHYVIEGIKEEGFFMKEE